MERPNHQSTDVRPTELRQNQGKRKIQADFIVQWAWAVEHKAGTRCVQKSQVSGEHVQGDGESRARQPSRPHFIQRLLHTDRCRPTTETTLYAIFSRVSVSHSAHQIPERIQLDVHVQVTVMRTRFPSASSQANMIRFISICRRDSTVVAPYEKWEYYDPRIKQMEQDRNYALNKTKKVAWFVSNCGARNGRLQFAHDLQKHIQVRRE